MPSAPPARSTEPAAPSSRPRFIDAHHHLWDPETAPYPWMGSGARKFMGDTAPVCTRYLLEKSRQLPPAIYDVPPDIDERVAALKLRSLGVQLDELNEGQKSYQNSWELGTA